MSKRSFDDKYFDDMLDRVLLDIEEEEIKESEDILLEFDDKLEFKTLFRHRWRMKRMIRSFEEKAEVKKKYNPMKRAVITVAVVVAFIFSTSVFANADISKIFQWLGFYTDEYVDISLSKDYTQKIVEATALWSHGSVYVPSRIPDGYTLEEINMYDNIIAIHYASSDGSYLNFSMRILENHSLLSIDNKDAKEKKLKIKGFEAIYVSNDSANTLMYNSNEYFFIFASNRLEERELKKIAENLEILENLVVR